MSLLDKLNAATNALKAGQSLQKTGAWKNRQTVMNAFLVILSAIPVFVVVRQCRRCTANLPRFLRAEGLAMTIDAEILAQFKRWPGDRRKPATEAHAIAQFGVDHIGPEAFASMAGLVARWDSADMEGERKKHAVLKEFRALGYELAENLINFALELALLWLNSHLTHKSQTRQTQS